MLARRALLASASSGDPGTLLLLHGDGANGSTSIIDSSVYNLTATLSGTTQISTAQTKSGFGQSIWIPNSSSQLAFASLPSQYNFGSGNFTIQYFVYPTHAGAVYARYFSIYTGTAGTSPYREITFRQSTASRPELFYFNGTSLFINSSANSINRNTWQHHAVIKNGTTLTAYINGIAQVTFTGVTAAFNFSTLSFAFIGSESGNGYYDEVKISDSAIYTSNFTPPSAPFTS